MLPDVKNTYETLHWLSGLSYFDNDRAAEFVVKLQQDEADFFLNAKELVAQNSTGYYSNLICSALLSSKNFPELFRLIFGAITSKPELLALWCFRTSESDGHGEYIHNFLKNLLDIPELFELCISTLIDLKIPIESLRYFHGKMHGYFFAEVLVMLAQFPDCFKRCFPKIKAITGLQCLGYNAGVKWGSGGASLLIRMRKNPDMFQYLLHEVVETQGLLGNLGFVNGARDGACIEELLTETFLDDPDRTIDCISVLNENPTVMASLAYCSGKRSGFSLSQILITFAADSDTFQLFLSVLINMPQLLESLGRKNDKLCGYFIRKILLALVDNMDLFLRFFSTLEKTPGLLNCISLSLGKFDGYAFNPELWRAVLMRPIIFFPFFEALLKTPFFVERLGYSRGDLDYQYTYITEVCNRFAEQPGVRLQTGTHVINVLLCFMIFSPVLMPMIKLDKIQGQDLIAPKLKQFIVAFQKHLQEKKSTYNRADRAQFLCELGDFSKAHQAIFPSVLYDDLVWFLAQYKITPQYVAFMQIQDAFRQAVYDVPVPASELAPKAATVPSLLFLAARRVPAERLVATPLLTFKSLWRPVSFAFQLSETVRAVESAREAEESDTASAAAGGVVFEATEMETDSQTGKRMRLG